MMRIRSAGVASRIPMSSVAWFVDEPVKFQEVVVGNVELGDGKRHPFFLLFKESKKNVRGNPLETS
jgi:hypothetical protein